MASKGKVEMPEAREERSAGVEEDYNDLGVRVMPFDYSVENHLRAMDRISELCGEDAEEAELDASEVKRLSSSVIFLREWRLFNYEPRDVNFAYELGSSKGKKAASGISLHQFSSAIVSKKEEIYGDSSSLKSRDFVMYAGGPVWGLDWCPRVHKSPDSQFKCEFIAIAAHPPGSSYHKIGAPLSGRGLIQIWSVLNISGNDGGIPPLEKPKRGRKKSAFVEEKPSEAKKPRGRPRKKPMKDDIVELDGKGQYLEPFDTQVPKNASNLLAIEGPAGNTQEDSVVESAFVKEKPSEVKRPRGRPRKKPIKDDIVELDDNGQYLEPLTSFPIPNDVAMPRVFLCLAHNGKVAWDVKWRPSNKSDTKSKLRMGFLAVLLGDGSLQVWEIPLPHTIKALYTSSLHGENTDPRFVKLEPVFRSSMLKSGGIQSIPLTVEWSASSPHEFLLAGCHDGTVALWKFSANVSSKDTRPLLRFSADTLPIRAVSWAPVESDTEGANIIVTAGHGGLKFWDMRDPFQPLWDLHAVPKNIYSLDWLPDPRCVVLAFDDGTMRTLSLSKAAYDVPVTGKPFVGTKQQGLHSYYYSSYSIWSVHVSRSTGMVAYCSADGTVLRFQLTTKAVDKDPSRNRAPIFLCGSLTMDESTVTINTPTTNTLLPLKKSLNKCGDTPIALRDVLSVSNKAKRFDDKMEKYPAFDDQTSALCYGDDPEVESEPEETLASLERKKPPNSGSGTEKNLEENLTLVAVDDEPRNTQGKEIEKVGKYELLPSKDVAMHRVRWNMNKGSERWLCYGGAAGLVCCQEIVLSDIDKKWAMKK